MDSGIKIIIVAAMAKKNRVIGNKGELPWKLHDDLANLKALTLNKTVIVGRKTQDSIVDRLGRSLPKRRTIVLTRDKSYNRGESEIASNWKEAIDLTKSDKEIFVLGGSEIYKLALPFADEMHLTFVDADIAGDAYFPEFNEKEWDANLEKKYLKDEKNEFDFAIWQYNRKV